MMQTIKTVHPKALDRTWIVVADGGAARILGVAPDHTHLVTLRDTTSPNMHQKTHDMVSDRGGRVQESATSTRHGVEAKTDPHDLAKERFIQDLGESLNKSRAAGEFDVLVLAVTRAQVHTLEVALNAATKACVAATVAKDLVKTPNAEIWERLADDGIMPPRLTGPNPARPKV